MKRLLVLLLLAGILCGQSIFMSGLSGIRADGRFTVYADGYERFDITGSEADAKKGLDELLAKILWEERLDGLLILYAYSPRIDGYEIVHGQKINVMAAIRKGSVAFGSPLLLGCY